MMTDNILRDLNAKIEMLDRSVSAFENARK